MPGLPRRLDPRPQLLDVGLGGVVRRPAPGSDGRDGRDDLERRDDGRRRPAPRTGAAWSRARWMLAVEPLLPQHAERTASRDGRRARPAAGPGRAAGPRRAARPRRPRSATFQSSPSSAAKPGAQRDHGLRRGLGQGGDQRRPSARGSVAPRSAAPGPRRRGRWRRPASRRGVPGGEHHRVRERLGAVHLRQPGRRPSLGDAGRLASSGRSATGDRRDRARPRRRRRRRRPPARRRRTPGRSPLDRLGVRGHGDDVWPAVLRPPTAPLAAARRRAPFRPPAAPAPRRRASASRRPRGSISSGTPSPTAAEAPSRVPGRSPSRATTTTGELSNSARLVRRRRGHRVGVGDAPSDARPGQRRTTLPCGGCPSAGRGSSENEVHPPVHSTRTSRIGRRRTPTGTSRPRHAAGPGHDETRRPC